MYNSRRRMWNQEPGTKKKYKLFFLSLERGKKERQTPRSIPSPTRAKIKARDGASHHAFKCSLARLLSSQVMLYSRNVILTESLWVSSGRWSLSRGCPNHEYPITCSSMSSRGSRFRPVLLSRSTVPELGLKREARPRVDLPGQSGTWISRWSVGKFDGVLK